MNHPTPETWMAFLYGEADRSLSKTLTAHLKQCPECAGRLREWKAGMMGLDAWREAKPEPSPGVLLPVLRWAVAAMVMVGFGFLAGRQAAKAGADPALAQAELRRTLREEMAQWVDQRMEGRWQDWKHEVASAVATSADEQRAAWQQACQQLGFNLELVDRQHEADILDVRQALKQADAVRVQDYSSLRKALETVAIVAEGNFRETQQNLWLLTSHQTASPPP